MIARTTLGRTLAVVLSLALSHATVPAAQAAVPATPQHLVDSKQVVARLLEGAQSREERVRLVQEALATPEAQRQATGLGLDAGKLRAAVPHLSDKELQDVIQRAARAKDVAAGHSSGDDGLVILALVLLLAGLALLAAVGDYNTYEDDCYCY